MLGSSWGDQDYWELNAPPVLTDGNGASVYYQFPRDLEIPSPFKPEAQVFAYQVSKAVVWPLNISLGGVQVSSMGNPRDFSFTFDAGENPQPGQEWPINLPINIEGIDVLINRVIAGENGYSFEYTVGGTSDPQKGNYSVITIEDINIEGYTPTGGGGGGGGGGPADGAVTGSRSLDYESIPTGILTVDIKAQLYHFGEPQSWTLKWSPENMPESLFGIRPLVDRWLETDDGYILIGHTEWTDNRINNVTEYRDMSAYDADGSSLKIQKLTFVETTALVDNLQANQWAYLLTGKDVKWPLTLRLEKVNIEFAQPVRFDLDLRSYGFTFER